MLAQMMAHGHLADPKPLDLQQHRQKPMHAVVELEGCEAVPSIGSERTPNIDNFIVQDVSAEVIGKLGGHPPQPGILPTLSNATDHIIVVEHLQQARDITGIILKVGIEGDYYSPACLFEPRIQRSTLPGVLAQADDTHL